MRILKAQRFQMETVFVFLLALLLIVYRDTASSLYHLWYREDNPTYSHGLLLLAVAIYLFVKRWQVLKPYLQFRFSLLAVVLLLFASLLWLFASLGHIQVVQQLLVLLLVFSLVNALFGRKMALKMVFPILLMVCAMPVWEHVNDSLRQIAVVSVTFLLRLSGFLVVNEGYNILVPAGVFKVDTGCSGLNQFVVACAVGFLYGYTRLRSGQFFAWAPMLSFIIALMLALLFAILANIVRIYIVVVSGQLSNMQHYFVTSEHVSLGWLVFAVSMFGYFFLVERVNLEGLFARGRGEDVEFLDFEKEVDLSPTKKVVQIGLIVVSILIGPLYLGYLTGHAQTFDVSADRKIDFPGAIQGWRLTQAPMKEGALLRWSPSIHGADLSGSTKYTSPEGEIELYVYHYVVQHQGKEAVHQGNRFANEYWDEKSSRTQTLTIAGHLFRIKESVLASVRGNNKLVWDWYYVGGVRTSSPYLAKIVNVLSIFRGRPEITRFVVAVDVAEDDLHARSLLSRFLDDAMAVIEGLPSQYER